MRIILVILILAVSLSAEATNFFRWGAETLKADYGVNGIAPYTLAPFGATTQDCTISHRGLCSSKLVVIGNDGNNQSLGWDLIGSRSYGTMPFNTVRANRPLYYRWWMRIETGFSWGSVTRKTKSSRVFNDLGGGSNGRGYTGYLFNDGVVIAECELIGGFGGCQPNTGAPGDDYSIKVTYTFPADSTWHEYVVMVKPNSNASCTAGVNCDAGFQLWVDNVSISTYSNWKLNSNGGYPHIEAWGGWMISPYFQLGATPSDGGVIYLDDWSTDDVYNSLIGRSAPTNPRIASLSFTWQIADLIEDVKGNV
jgi:hypothetical protein